MSLSVKNMFGGSGGGGASPFAWGKYESNIVTSTLVSHSINENVLSLNGNAQLLDTLTNDDFIGFKFKTNIVIGGTAYNDATIEYTTATISSGIVYRCRCYNSSDAFILQYGYDYNATTHRLTITNLSTGQASYEVTSDNWGVFDFGKTFLEYVTDKNPLKYPNGEVADDGFFYRYANEGLYTWEKSNIEKTLNPSYFGEIAKVPNDSYYVTTCVHDDKLYAFSDKSYYTWADGTWNYEGTLPQVMSCSASYGGKLYAFYGNSSSNLGKYYVLEDGTWVENNMPIVESGNYLDPYYCSNPVEYDGKMWIHGACPNLGGSFLFSFDGTSWTRHGDINSAYPSPSYIRNSMVVWNGELYSYVANRGLQKYSLANDTWTTIYSWTAIFGLCLYVGTDNNLYLNRTNATTWTSYIFNGTSFVQDTTFVAIDTGNQWLGVSKYKESIYFVFYAKVYIRGRYETEIIPFDIVISDNENAYPDGGEQDGYYYGKLKSSVAWGTVTNTENNILNIKHNLGAVPKKFFCINPSAFGSSGFSTTRVPLLCDYGYTGADYLTVHSYYSSTYPCRRTQYKAGQYSYAFVNENEIQFADYNYYGYLAHTFYWFAILEE